MINQQTQQLNLQIISQYHQNINMQGKESMNKNVSSSFSRDWLLKKYPESKRSMIPESPVWRLYSIQRVIC